MGKRPKQALAGNSYFTFDGSVATSWSVGVTQGTLGEMPVQAIGFFDTRPWEGRPRESVGDRDWEAHTTKAHQGNLTFRAVLYPNDNLFGASMQADASFWRNASLSLIIGAFDAPFGRQIGAINEDPTSVAGSATTASLPLRQVWMGPNIMPNLASGNVVEVDLLRWSYGARYVAVWLKSFWVRQATINGRAVAWELWDVPAKDWTKGVWTVTWPARTIVDGPFVIPTDANTIFRWGPFDGAALRRYGVVNGGPVGITVNLEEHVGVGSITTSAAVASLGDTVLPLAAASLAGIGASHTTIHATNTVLTGAVSGPVLVSVAGGGGL